MTATGQAKKKSLHEAKPSMLGFRYQPLFALLVLWDEAQDDLDEVSVETDDDVVLAGEDYRIFYQTKHSLSNLGKVNEKNDGLWKTLRVWSNYVDDNSVSFVFVTVKEISENSDY